VLSLRMLRVLSQYLVFQTLELCLFRWVERVLLRESDSTIEFRLLLYCDRNAPVVLAAGGEYQRNSDKQLGHGTAPYVVEMFLRGLTGRKRDGSPTQDRRATGKTGWGCCYRNVRPH